MTPALSVDEFRVLFNANYSDLLAYAARRVTLYEDAKDVVSGVFAVAWRRRAALPVSDIERRMWLYGTARRVLANLHRSEVRLSQLRQRLIGLDVEVVPDHGENDDASDLAVAVKALNALSVDDREILLLSIWEELSPTQIGMIFDRSASWVSVRLHRAKSRLRQEFLQQVKEPSPRGHVIDRRAHGDVAPETTS